MLPTNLKERIDSLIQLNLQKEEKIEQLNEEVSNESAKLLSDFETYIANEEEPLEQRFNFWMKAPASMKRFASYDNTGSPYEKSFVMFMHELAGRGYDYEYNQKVDVTDALHNFSVSNGKCYGDFEEEECKEILEFVLKHNLGFTYQQEEY